MPPSTTGLTSDDPLGTGDDAAPAIKKKPAANNAPIGLGVIVGMPWLMFSILSILFAFAYHHYSWAVWLVATSWFLLVLIFFVLDARNRMLGGWFRCLGFLCLFGAINGCICGSYNYWSHMFQYWSYMESSTFSNVLPTEPAESHGDAGTIMFADTARIDTTRAVGYMSTSTYCVAPILDTTTVTDSLLGSRSEVVEYWAAGMDCCPARGDFNCNDAWDAQARSGLVIVSIPGHDGSISNRGLSLWARMWKTEHDYYVMAVREAEGSYDLKSANRPLFVRWVRDPQRVQNDLWRGGVGYVVASVCVYFLVSVIVGSATQMYSKRQATAQGSQPAVDRD